MKLLWKYARSAPAVLTLVLSLAAPASAGTYFAWTTDDGVRSFTDDAKRVPARYKGSARERNLRSLKGYKRYTPSAHVAGDLHERLGERLEGLRDNARPAQAPRVQDVGGNVHVRIDLEQLEIDVPSGSEDAPVVVEEIRTRSTGSLATRTVKVIRQGDRVVAVVKPLKNDTNPSFLPRDLGE